MIDTINVIYRLSAQPTLVRVLLDKGKRETQLWTDFESKVEKLKDVVTVGPVLSEVGSDLRITLRKRWRKKGKPTYEADIEGSVPKLLYKTNSVLLTTQKEIDLALSSIPLILTKKGFPIKSGAFFWRLDFVWNFKNSPNPEILLAHFATIHSELNLAVSLNHRGGRLTGVTWHGKKLSILMYDQVPRNAKFQNKVSLFHLKLS